MSDFFLAPIPVTAPIDNTVVAAYQGMMIRAQQALPWLPALSGESAGFFYANPPAIPRLNATPAGLTPDQQAQWQQVYQVSRPMESAMLRQAWAEAKAQGAAAAANTNFWNNIYRGTAAVATMGLSEAWANLIDRLRQVRDARSAGDANIVAMRAALARLPITPDTAAARTKWTNQINAAIVARNALETKLAGALSPLGPFASNARQDAGLSDFPIGMTIGAAVVLGVVGAVTLVSMSYLSWKKQTERDNAALAQDASTLVKQGVAAGSISPQQGAVLIKDIMTKLTATATGKATLVAAVLVLGGLGYWLATRRRGPSPSPAPAAA